MGSVRLMARKPKTTEKTIEVLLVAPHVLIRESVGHLLNAEPGLHIGGQCAHMEEALQIVKQKTIDVVLLDSDLGALNSRNLIRMAKIQGFEGKFVLITAEENTNNTADLIRSGICGIFLKSNPSALLARMIRDVCAGSVWLSQEQLQNAFGDDADKRFSRREREVLSRVCEGFTNREVGLQLGVSESSVKATIQQLFVKLGVRNRSRLVRVALEQHKNEL